jgi:RNA polymerase sigma-70 factor (sigma-E family)
VGKDELEFRDYVQARLPGLRRSAFLLCGDRSQADDLVSIALGKLYRSWRKVRGLDHPDSYVRRMLVNAYLDERRRPWHRERSTDAVPEPAGHQDPDVAERLTVIQMLSRLPARQRAVLVLRFLDDLSVDETAEALGCSGGTVKTQTSRGLATLRDLLATSGYETLNLTVSKEPSWDR